jgi:hypothetical protein
MQRLFPNVELLGTEYVLVQAWKKTSAYIRYHNWFADTLELDEASADLPRFLERLATRISSGEWQSKPARLVLAPKSQPWHVSAKTGRWTPVSRLRPPKVRPLAHVRLEDQVIATAMLLCLAERVETLQGDPRQDVSSKSRKPTISYGNRLFCDLDEKTDSLVHRWGSSKLYRAYFQDYRVFLARPESIANELCSRGRQSIILQTDLSQFYDRVRPRSLTQSASALREEGDDPEFFDLFEKVFNWSWHERDQGAADRYASACKIPDFQSLALPQGLVAAGFMSNLYMLQFDNAARSAIDKEIAPGVFLRNVCRYVDDIRLTLETVGGLSLTDAQDRATTWLEALLSQSTFGMELSDEKTTAAAYGGDDQPLIRQSRKMERIQTAVSGGFDASGGEEVIQAIEALVRSQTALSAAIRIRAPEALRPVPDVKDETIGRFAAARFRTTFRSLRPLLDDRKSLAIHDAGEETSRRTRLTRGELDEEAKAFAFGLVQNWIENPANVRLLRVALDLWPSPQILQAVLDLLEPYIAGEIHGNARRIALYCLSEILRAGATETGFIEDREAFPAEVSLEEYRALLAKTALRIITRSVPAIPWYLRQQALLFIAAYSPSLAAEIWKPINKGRYWGLLGFLLGHHQTKTARDFAVLAVVARRSFLSAAGAVRLTAPSVTPERFREVAARDIEFARDLWRVTNIELAALLGVAEDIGADTWTTADGMRTLRDVVKEEGPLNKLRNEIGVLSFALRFAETANQRKLPDIITPSTVQISLNNDANYPIVEGIIFRSAPTPPTYKSIYTPPKWADKDEIWRFQLGYLLRYILTARVDFSLPVRPPSWKEEEPIYRPTRGHWVQRHYAFYNGHEAFGDDWLAISQYTQDMLFSLLLWPGCYTSDREDLSPSLSHFIESVRSALNHATAAVGEGTGLLMLPILAPIPGSVKGGRPLRGCVVQSVLPQDTDFTATDLELSQPEIRRRHSNHLSTALAAVEKMLDLRETHKTQNKRLDWLIFPELAVHPDDVRRHLIPFARAFKTAILTGITYERLVDGLPLVNSAMWIIPRMVPGQGLQTIVRRQGKQHLSPMESPFNQLMPTIMGFRPCQWLIGYEWSDAEAADPLWLTASVCYDATDLKLVADLRDRSDVFAIPALNRDVGTFDHMAQALHYHMYQLVVVANNGSFGGSNAHVPRRQPYERQVFHTHGQPQASISFFEIDNIEEMKGRHRDGLLENGIWKYPPAGSR